VLPGLNCASAEGDASDGAGSVTGGVDCGFTVRVAVRVRLPLVDVMVTAVELVTVDVVTVNCAVVAPEGTFTLAGTAAALFELERDTTRPPLGAALVRVTVPVALLPPITLDGETLTVERLAGGGTGVTARVAVRVVLPWVAVIVADVDAETAVVAIAKLALVAPDATVTVVGLDATVAFELERLTTSPPLPAALVSVTVPVALLPPTTLVGLMLSAESACVVVVDCTVNRRELENGPAVPAALTARTRQNSWVAGSPETVAFDTLTLAV
jgi:hypothetical protein